MSKPLHPSHPLDTLTRTKTAAVYERQREAAAHNRLAILSAAHDLLTASPTASMNEIAKRAGVGAGTLYRHFPTREDLILAVYRHDIEQLVDSVDGLLASLPPLEAFVTWFETLAAHIRIKHGLGEALQHAAVQRSIDETYAPVVGAIAKLLHAGVASGSIRAGLDAADILVLMGFLWRVGADEDGLARGRRLVQTVFDGIRPRIPPAEHKPESSGA